MRYRYLVDARNLRGIQNGFVDSASPEVFFIVAAVSQYLGAALAFSIFDNLGTSTVATLRVLLSLIHI